MELNTADILIKWEILSIEAWRVRDNAVIYGKTKARAGRKMGHLITRAAEIEKAEAAARLARKRLEKSICLN